MKPIQLGGPRFAAVVVALAAAMLAYVDARHPIAGDAQGAPASSPAERRAVEAAVARTNLVARLEAGMGDAFAGAWYDPTRAGLHVGVASAVGSRAAEDVAARAGLGESVILTAVDSTWEELEAVQDKWDSRLGGLFERQQVATGLRAQHNAVEVELTSSVPEAQRAALERSAAQEDVEVLVTTASQPYFHSEQDARCKKYVSPFADCNPPLVGGVYIDDGNTGKWVGCSSGPTVRRVDRSTKANRTDTFVLTAGHCLDQHGKVGQGWWAVTNETPGTQAEIGKAVQYINAETDVGVIEVTTKFWSQAKDPPLVPTIASWDATSESNPFTVTNEANPAEGAAVCHSGQRTGTTCGTVAKTGETKEFNKVKFTEVTKVEMEPAATVGAGDSGSPWYASASPKAVLGIHIASERQFGTEFGEIAYLQPLSFVLAKLKAKGLDLELLKDSNKTRHVQAKGAKYPVTFHGGLSGGPTEKFTIEGGNVECMKTSHHGTVAEATSTWTDTPKYEECTALGFTGATVNMEGCAYEFNSGEKTSTDNFKSHVDVACPSGQSIKIAAGTCKAEIKAQAGLTTVDLIDDTSASPKKDVTVRPTVTGVAYTVTQDGFLCPLSGVGSKTGGEYTSSANITVTGQSTTEPAEKIDVEIADP
jgi:Trypsin